MSGGMLPVQTRADEAVVARTKAFFPREAVLNGRSGNDVSWTTGCRTCWWSPWEPVDGVWRIRKPRPEDLHLVYQAKILPRALLGPQLPRRRGRPDRSGEGNRGRTDGRGGGAGSRAAFRGSRLSGPAWPTSSRVPPRGGCHARSSGHPGSPGGAARRAVRRPTQPEPRLPAGSRRRGSRAPGQPSALGGPGARVGGPRPEAAVPASLRSRGSGRGTGLDGRPGAGHARMVTDRRDRPAPLPFRRWRRHPAGVHRGVRGNHVPVRGEAAHDPLRGHVPRPPGPTAGDRRTDGHPARSCGGRECRRLDGGPAPPGTCRNDDRRDGGLEGPLRDARDPRRMAPTVHRALE